MQLLTRILPMLALAIACAFAARAQAGTPQDNNAAKIAATPANSCKASPTQKKVPAGGHPESAPACLTRLAAINVAATAPAGSAPTTIGGYGSATLHNTPATVTVIGRREIDNHQIQSLRELADQDASMGSDYAPVGYIQNITIRGFPLDLATGYRINGLTVTGEQNIALEDKSGVEVLQGLAGINAGVMSPGGVVDFLSKPPADVKTMTLGTDAQGSRYAALDYGRWLTPAFGLRANLAGEDIHSYVEHADGWRALYSLGAEWRMAPNATLDLDSDYTATSERSVSAYQLLGGSMVPAPVDRSRMLGYEPWDQPTSPRSSNSSARFNYSFSDAWKLTLAAGHSKSVVQDNVTFAYGCYNAPICATGAPAQAFFAPNGDYDIYDYRSPNETYVDDDARASVVHQIDNGPIRQTLTFGARAFHHTEALPGAVFNYVGTANIADIEPPVFAPSPAEPSPVIPRLDSWQHSLFALDRIELGQHWQVIGGGHFTHLEEHAWDGSGTPEPAVALDKFLPQAALLWTPVDPLTTYVSYAEGLSLGAQAPYWTTNSGDTLAPRLSHQVETGAKYQWFDTLALGLAVFRINEPYQFAEPAGAPGSFTFAQRGREIHTGLALSADGEASDNLTIHASIALMRARAVDTGVAAYEGHQVLNVPVARTVVYLDYRLPGLPALTLLGGWRYASPNTATPDGQVRVPSYNVFDAGLSYASTWGGHALTWRLTINNLFNSFYWTYTGNDGNDSYLLPGAPRLVRLSLTFGL